MVKILGKIDLSVMPKPKRKLRKDEHFVADTEGNSKIFRSEAKAWEYFTKVPPNKQ